MHLSLGVFSRAKCRFLLIVLVSLLLLILASIACGCGGNDTAKNFDGDISEFPNSIDLGENNVVHAEIHGQVLETKKTEHQTYVRLKVAGAKVHEQEGGGELVPGTEVVFAVQNDQQAPEQGQMVTAYIVAQKSVDGYKMSARRVETTN